MAYKWPSRSFRKWKKMAHLGEACALDLRQSRLWKRVGDGKKGWAAESQRSQEHHISTMDHQGSGPVMLMFKKVETKHHQHYNGYLIYWIFNNVSIEFWIVWSNLQASRMNASFESSYVWEQYEYDESWIATSNKAKINILLS